MSFESLSSIEEYGEESSFLPQNNDDLTPLAEKISAFFLEAKKTPPSFPIHHRMKNCFRKRRNPFKENLNIDSFSYPFSKTYDLQKPECQGEIGFINGILTNFQEAQNHALFLSHLADDHNIHGIFKANRPLNLELLESFCKVDTTPVSLLQTQWRQFFSQHPDLKYLQICHSQGALHVKKALLGLKEEERKRIIVIAIAPQTIVPQDLCYLAANYISKRDPVPLLEGTKKELHLCKEVHFLTPHKNAPTIDHDFESPTYKEVLQKHLQEYLIHPRGLS